MKTLLCLTIALISIKFGFCHFKKHRSTSGLPYRGRYTGRCRGDGLYYRDSYSFVTCTHSIGYLQPCPPGTRNKRYETYSPRGGPHFCTENLVNIGYTVYNRHPLHGPRSLRKKAKRYMDRQRGYSHGRIHKPFRLFSRHKRPRPPPPPPPLPPPPQRVHYAKPEGRMYTGRVEHNFYGHQKKQELMHHHTGPEFHGPYRDQAKEMPESVDEDTKTNEQTEGYETHIPAKNREQYGKTEDEMTDRNDDNSELEHPLLTFFQKSKKPTIEAHQIRLIKPSKSESRFRNYHETSSRSRKPEFFGEDRSAQLMSEKDSGHHAGEEEHMTARVNSPQEQRPDRFEPPGQVEKPRVRVDLTRIKLIPPSEDQDRPEPEMKRPRESVHGREQYRHRRPDFKTPRQLAELKEKILAKYREEQRKQFRTPIYDQYSHSKDTQDSREDRQRMQRHNSMMHSEKSRKRNGFYRYQSDRRRSRPDIANDQSKNSNEDEKLLMTIIGMGDKIISYNKAAEYTKPSSKYSPANKKKKMFYDWRSASYKKPDEGN